ncbi:MAG: alpha-hydroxy acid oxidase [Vicinamibacteria bacterium]
MPVSRRQALGLAGAAAALHVVPKVASAALLESTQATQATEGSLNPFAGIASVTDFEPRAHERMTHNAWEYINGGAGDEITLRWNREAYDKIRLRTRVLVDVSKLDTKTRLLGQDLAYPILLAPTAYHKLVHPEGELETARGASTAGATMVVSSFANTAIEDIARVAKEPLWFQLYVQPDRGFTKSMVERAQAAGCRAICVTVDTPLAGVRNREERVGFALPKGLELPHLKGLTNAAHPPREGEIFSAILDPTLTWKDIEWLRSFAKVPVLLKGVQSADDADQAARLGVAGIIVSNHGARNLDTVPATIDSLPSVVERVARRMPVLVDGGIRRGTDVLKALASGASAVLIGRPYLYALGVAGAPGVARALSILRKEFEIAMALTGRRSIAEIDKGVIW